MSTPVERLRAWTLWMHDNPCYQTTPAVYDVEAVLAMLPPQPSPICAGHNPDKLTEEQVGVKEGWRLLTDEENAGTRTNTNDIECWRRDHWDDTGWAGDASGLTYRTKRPPGWFLPKPKQRVPLTAEDLPAVCWLRHTNTPLSANLVYRIDINEVLSSAGWTTFTSLMAGWQYSPDRKTWHPCYKEV